MGERPSVHETAFPRFWMVPLVAGTALLSYLAGAGLIRRWSSPDGPPSKSLSPAARDRLREKASDLAPSAILYFACVENESAALAKLPAQDLNEEDLLSFCGRVTSGSDGFVAACEEEVEAVSRSEGVEAAMVRDYLSKEFRALAARVPPVSFGVIPWGGCPMGLRILNAPRLVSLQAPGPEEGMGRAIDNLIEVLKKLPPQSNGARGIREAILALRRAISLFDATPVAIVFTSPDEGAIASSIPTIRFEVIDSGSGPDPVGCRLEAVNTGPLVQETTDLSGTLQVTLNDQVNGVVKFAATDIPPSAIKDGFITLHASGTDYALSALASATRAIVIDRQAPTLETSSPISGGVFPSTSVTVDITISDLVSGVEVPSIKLTLNGNDASGSVSISGSGSGASIKGVLAARAGENTLAIAVKDRAGNSTSAEIKFSVISAQPLPEFPPFPLLEIGIEAVSGDGQEGMVGECSTSPLVVRTFRKDQPSEAVELVPLSINIMDGGGFVQADAFFTGNDGRASFKYVLGPLPGTSRIRVGVTGDPSAGFAEFALAGRLPTLKDISKAGPCNTRYGTTEFPGSALPRIFTIKAERPDGNPLAGETVEPVSFRGFYPDGTPIAENMGYFVPSRALTDSSGKSRFAFVIANDASPGPFVLQFSLPRFVNGQGEILSLFIQAEALNESEVPRPIKIASGQGQVALPGLGVADPLKVFTYPMFMPMNFNVLEGSVGFVEVTDGDFLSTETDACGNPVVKIQSRGSDGLAGVRYVMGADTLALITNDQYTDVFVIGPPESRLVRATDPSAEVRGFTSTPVSAPEPARQFLLEARLPVGLQAEVKADLQSLDLCDRPLAVRSGVAPAEKADVPLTRVTTDRFRRYDVYRSPSSKPIAAFSDTLGLEEPVPTLPANLTGLQVVEGGRLRITYKSDTPGFNLQDVTQETSIFMNKSIPQVGEAFRLQVQRIDRADLPRTNRYRWKLNLNGTELDPLERDNNGILWVRFSPNEADRNLGATGTDQNNAVVIPLPEGAGTRRSRFRIATEIAGAGESPRPADVLVALSRSRLAGAAPPFDGSSAAAGGADLRRQFGFYTAEENEERFWNIDEASQFMQRYGVPGPGQPGALETRGRIVYTTTQHRDMQNSFATTPLFWEIAIADLSVRPEDAQIEAVARVLGTVVLPLALQLDGKDLSSVIDHEMFHARDQGFSFNVPTMVLGINYRDIVVDFMRGLLLEPVDRRRALQQDYTDGANFFFERIAEVEALHRHLWLESLREDVSHYFLRRIADELSKNLLILITSLRAGIPKRRNIPDSIVGKKLSVAMTRTIVNRTQEIHRLIPPALKSIKGPTVWFDAPEEIFVPSLQGVLASYDIVIPKFVFRD